jgi:hypothetical protein
MRYSLRLPAAVITGVLMLGCDDPSGVSTPETSPPSFSVERSTVNSGFAFSDGRRIVFIGFTLEDMIGLCAGTGFNNSEVNQLIVTRPDGSVKFLQQGKDVNVVVFDTTDFSCDALLAAPHFTGTGRVNATDNDLLLSGNRANASKVHFTGTVTDEGGQRWHVEAIGHQVLARGSTLDNLIFLNVVTRIHLTPVGG